jgi:large subunit ribosomal protein L24
MQKVLRRSLLARNQSLRKIRRNDKKELKREVKEFHRDRIMRDKALRSYVKAERSARREDWLLGPLAPQRDVGDQKGIYGTMSPMAIRQPKVPERQREEYINFAIGDRVVIVRGRSKGKIAAIRTIDEETMTVGLEGMNTVRANPGPNLGMA